jgi:hypothetical protein|tara:strand:- start:1882 stop:2073 length:192 start_codon:yes stop_codon:yes gene_type:complete
LVIAPPGYAAAVLYFRALVALERSKSDRFSFSAAFINPRKRTLLIDASATGLLSFGTRPPAVI